MEQDIPFQRAGCRRQSLCWISCNRGVSLPASGVAGVLVWVGVLSSVPVFVAVVFVGRVRHHRFVIHGYLGFVYIFDASSLYQ